MRKAALLISAAACLAGLSCSIPILESQNCIEARTAAGEFYSFHFGGDMRFSKDVFISHEKYLTSDFAGKIKDSPENTDPFTTASNDFPKAFRIGACSDLGDDQVRTEVLLFWRDDNRSEQRAIHVDLKKENGRWLISNIAYQ
ncbi:MAG TPA: DUF3828 domain-containing protein [Pyrinomonadaceae bacterium]|jgi:hypothetical protein|nr:DUF3828 domain-containing protein [Pyrinomonadaceae bacterium]